MHESDADPKSRSTLATRRSLLGRIRNWRDDESWQEFFNIYWQFIYATATRAGLTDTEAEEVVQLTVLTVANKINEFEYDPDRGSFRRWLYTQARWRIADQLRKRQREQRLVKPHGRKATATRTATIEQVADPVADFAVLWEQEWKEAVRRNALDGLRRTANPKHFQVFDLYVMKSWSAARIRDTLGVSIPQVYLISSRLRRQLKKESSRIEKEMRVLPPINSPSTTPKP